jgi:hypothetical protein
VTDYDEIVAVLIAEAERLADETMAQSQSELPSLRTIDP